LRPTKPIYLPEDFNSVAQKPHPLSEMIDWHFSAIASLSFLVKRFGKYSMTSGSELSSAKAEKSCLRHCLSSKRSVSSSVIFIQGIAKGGYYRYELVVFTVNWFHFHTPATSRRDHAAKHPSEHGPANLICALSFTPSLPYALPPTLTTKFPNTHWLQHSNCQEFRRYPRLRRGS
jgi:hypothetical protein